MYTLYSTENNKDFTFKTRQKTLPKIIKELSKWISLRTLAIYPSIAKMLKQPSHIKEYWYVFKGKSNIDGIMIGKVSIIIKRFKT